MTVRKSISFTEPHDQWLKAQIASGRYTSESEIVRDLIRQQQDKEEQLMVLKRAIEDGIESGVSDQQVPDIMKEVEAKLKADGKL